VWLLYRIQPHGATSKMAHGRCKGRAHLRTTLGLPGRRVLVSRKWSGKTLADHRADGKRFVLDALAAIGVVKNEPQPVRLIWQKVAPRDPNLLTAPASYLGHSDPDFTLKVYTQLMPSSKQRTRRAVDAVFGQMNEPDEPAAA
jgi:hypothetical protein